MIDGSYDSRTPVVGPMPRVDAHHHVWTLARGDYGWLTPGHAPIYRDFALEDLRPFLTGAQISATVLVQAAPTIEETEFLLRVAQESMGLVGGIVGWVDLSAADAIPTLTSLAREPLLKSIRPMLQDLPDPEWILRTDVREALSALPSLGVRFDALVTPAQLPALLRMLERQPDLAVVVDHGGKPPIADGGWQPWSDLIAAIARHPQAHCKLSGLANEAGPHWSSQTLGRYVDHLIECFGARRLMWGSDWPVVDLAGGYAKWWNATDALLQRLSTDDRAAVLGGNARRFYGIA